MCSAGWWGLSTLEAGPSCEDGVQYGRLGRGQRGGACAWGGGDFDGMASNQLFFLPKYFYFRGFLTQGRRVRGVHSRPYGVRLFPPNFVPHGRPDAPAAAVLARLSRLGLPVLYVLFRPGKVLGPRTHRR